MKGLVHISFAKIDFECPYCGLKYEDNEDKYLDRCNKNKSGYTKIKCKCGNRFGFVYDITGQALGFMLNPSKEEQDKANYFKSLLKSNQL